METACECAALRNARMRVGGQTASIAAYDGQEHPPSTDVIEFLKDCFVAHAKKGLQSHRVDDGSWALPLKSVIGRHLIEACC